MIVGITGASRGLGKAIADYCASAGNTVRRWDSSTDLRIWNNRQHIIKQSADVDVFFSVAKPDFTQTELLFEWWSEYQDKLFISIGSKVVNYDLWGDDIHMKRYHTQKISLQHATRQIKSPLAIIINPGHLYNGDNYNYDELLVWCDQHIKEYVNGS